MLSKQEQSILRAKLFRHLDGIAIAPTAFSLHQKGVCDYLLEHKSVDITGLAQKFNANEGYLNIALRLLCSQGWLKQKCDNETNQVTYEVIENTATAFSHFHMYKNVVDLLKMSGKYHPRKFELEPFLKLETCFKDYQNNCGIAISNDEATQEIQQQILSHIEGVIVGPTLVHLGMSGMLHKYFMETRFKAEEFHVNPYDFGRLLDLLTQLGLFSKINESYEFTAEGLFFAKRASAYGVTVSYIPTFRNLDELLFGNPTLLKHSKKGEQELHVDREMNVWGSGGAHVSYFKAVDEIIVEIFNKPIDEQPKGILDMGCGNGEFLIHLFNVIYTQTRRGSMLDQYPLTLIGVDYNEAALKVSRANLIQADVWAKVIWGDIGNPDLLASDLDDKYGIDLKDLLNVRSFLDHNRIWEPASQSSNRTSSSTGAYAFEGKRLSNNEVSDSLRQHFEKWTPYVERFGLLLIELHTVEPELIANNLGRSACTAYDATHGYSDQYIIEIEEFMAVLKDAGLHADKNAFRKYPSNELANVTVNLFKA